MTASSCLPDIFSIMNCDKLLKKLLCKVSDTTALHYISSSIEMISALQNLGLPLEAPSQVQLIDSWLAAQKKCGKDTCLHSENALKALRWLKQTVGVKTREAFRDLRVEPSGKVTAANSYLKHNPKHYNQTNRRALTKLCLGQAAQNRLSRCGCKAVLQAPDFTSFFSRVT